MGRVLADGTVDLFFDSAFPAVAVQDLTGSEIILRRWKGGIEENWSTYVALRDGADAVDSMEDLVGKVVAFEEPRSTSGFVLPAGTLLQRGFKLREVEGPDATVAADEIGYLFSGDEENTFELILEGKVAGGGVSNGDFEDLPADMKEKLAIFDETMSVPRQLVSVRPGLDRPIVNKVQQLLISLDQTDEGRSILEGLKKTSRFDPLRQRPSVSLSS